MLTGFIFGIVQIITITVIKAVLARICPPLLCDNKNVSYLFHLHQ